jgi:hypothetical protein
MAEKESLIDKILDPARLKSICILAVVLTVCAILLVRNGMSVEIGSVKITKVAAPVEKVEEITP